VSRACWTESSLIGSGPILDRLWTKPSMTTIGINAPTVENASNTLVPQRLGEGLHADRSPTRTPRRRMPLLRAHLEAHVPWGAKLTVTLKPTTGPGFSATTDGPVYDQARAALADAFGVESVEMGVGGSIPFVAAFAERFPEAAILVTGVEDPDTRAHGANESLHLGDWEKACVAEAIFLARLGAMGRLGTLACVSPCGWGRAGRASGRAPLAPSGRSRGRPGWG
jgi:acetylornithine deacetylase/succinyl-diaminopimelate desuccinylase-like protein